MSNIIFNVKTEYYDLIECGLKTHEFRLDNAYWQKRLLNEDGSHKSFDKVIIKKGYPRKGDFTRQLERPWTGFERKVVSHPHFGKAPVEVFAIRVN